MLQTLPPGQPAALTWHDYDCAACRCAYRYRRPGRAEGETDACPECGYFPPRARTCPHWGHQLVVAVFGAAVAVIGLWIAAAGRMTVEGVAYLVACAVVVLVLFHLALASMDPNSSRARNLRAARRHVSAGRAQVLRAGKVRGDEESPQASDPGLLLYLSLAAFAVVLALAPVAVAGAKGCRGNPVAPRMVAPDRVVQATPATTVGVEGATHG